MAKGARGVDRRQVKDWFSGLTFEVQRSVLDDFGQAMEAKAGRIAALERELAALRGENAPSVPARSGPAAPAAKPKAAAGAKGSPNKGKKLAPKYRHPETGETWAGRGVHPTWIVVYLKKRGRKLDDLLIKK